MAVRYLPVLEASGPTKRVGLSCDTIAALA
jgi:hypothetical protein